MVLDVYKVIFPSLKLSAKYTCLIWNVLLQILHCLTPRSEICSRLAAAVAYFAVLLGMEVRFKALFLYNSWVLKGVIITLKIGVALRINTVKKSSKKGGINGVKGQSPCGAACH